MGIRLAGIIVALLVATVPAAAQDATPKDAAPKPAPKPAEAPKAAAKKPAAKPGAAKTTDDPDSAVDIISPASPAALQAAGWRVIDDPATGVRLGLPGTLVPKLAASRMGSRWMSKQGQIDIETFRMHEAALPALFDDEKKLRRRTVEHSTLKPDSFVISGMQGLKRFVELAQANGSELRGITIMFDQATEGTMAPIAAKMAGVFQGFPDRSANPPGLKRGIEYGTAIVVSDRGHLLASAQVTDQCQSITVPGLGHAERIAADSGSDLALLRLYGAHNLAPPPLGIGTPDNLTLVGIADPVAQAGAASVAHTQAQLTPQGLYPAPKPGFSGAAAIDGQNRLAGMVSLKWVVVAANTPASANANPTASTAASQPASANPPKPVSQPITASQAALVPADTIRTFLTAQGVAPATAPASIDQSVLQVICVRK
jgi:hypothetical protein